MTRLDTSTSETLLKVRRLDAQDLADFREVRLEGLKRHPEAYGSSWEDESAKPASWWSERLQSNAMFGGWVGEQPLMGLAGFHATGGLKRGHKGLLWGMYVRPDARGTGLAAALVQRVIEHARPIVEEIRLTVVVSNVVAHRLYSAAGFEPYGIERRALKLDNEYYDETLMALQLQRP